MSILLKTPGTYILLLSLPTNSTLQIGRAKHRQLIFESGYYCYVGSALGPGGLRSRLLRHASETTRKHWHIDYFNEQAKLLGAFVFASKQRLECRLAKKFDKSAETCIEGFGASDCACMGHLFFLGTTLDESRFIKEVEEKLAAQYFSRQDIA